MKCPKCGFTSFDFLENCKKCGQELQNHKTKFGLRSLIFPNLGEQQEQVVEAVEPTGAQDAQGGEGLDFGFDFMSEEAAQGESAAEETAPAPEPAAEESAEEDFSFDAEEETEEDFAFSAADEEDEGFDFTEPESDKAEDDFDFSEEEAPAETAEESGDDEFAFTEADAELDGDPAGDDLDFSDDAEQTDDLGSWDEPTEDSLEEDAPEKKTAETEEPSDPFDLRGSADREQTPGESQPHIELAELDEAESISPGFTDEPTEADIEPLPSEEEPVELCATPEEEPPQPSLFGFQEEGAADEDVTDVGHADIFTEPAEQQSADLVPPPLFPRLAASFCDLLVLAGIFVLFLMVGELTLAEEQRVGLLPGADTLLALSGPYFLVFFALCFGYFTLFHYLTGQTPGKMLFRLRVENLVGDPLNLSQAFLRSVGGLCSLLIAGVGYLAIVFSQSRRGWNDLLAGSRLVLISEQGEEPFAEPGEF